MHALLLAALWLCPQDRFDFAAAWRDATARFHAACDEHKVVGASLLFVRGRETLGHEHHGLGIGELRVASGETQIHGGLAVVLRETFAFGVEDAEVSFGCAAGIPLGEAAAERSGTVLLSHRLGARGCDGLRWRSGGRRAIAG